MSHPIFLDVSSMMYRAYFAMRETGVFAPDGRPMGALHGYLDMVSRLLAVPSARRGHPRLRPRLATHGAHADLRRLQGRPAAGAGGPHPTFALLREVLDFTGMTQAQAPDWEAEDAIGAVCAVSDAGDRLEIVSGDRDLLQLVRDSPPPIRVLYTLRGVSELHEFDEAAVLEKYGVPVSHTRSSRSSVVTRRMASPASKASARRPPARW